MKWIWVWALVFVASTGCADDMLVVASQLLFAAACRDVIAPALCKRPMAITATG